MVFLEERDRDFSQYHPNSIRSQGVSAKKDSTP